MSGSAACAGVAVTTAGRAPAAITDTALSDDKVLGALGVRLRTALLWIRLNAAALEKKTAKATVTSFILVLNTTASTIL